MLKILSVMKLPVHFALALFSTIVFALIYVYTQVLGVIHNVDIWFANISPVNLTLFVIFSALFGIAMSFQIYNWRQPKTCNIKGSAGSTSAATVISLLVAQCPACASLGALFLPFSVITFIGEFSVWITLASIGLLLFTINYLGGFKQVKN
ncbi:MAG TPA: hypothetical protein VJH04_00365 [archaeon]|nr:hypothetical protein [archaeon]